MNSPLGDRTWPPLDSGRPRTVLPNEHFTCPAVSADEHFTAVPSTEDQLLAQIKKLNRQLNAVRKKKADDDHNISVSHLAQLPNSELLLFAGGGSSTDCGIAPFAAL